MESEARPIRKPTLMREAEYTALRDEILKRNEIRQRLVELALISAGAVLAAGLKIEDFEQVMYLYPVAVFFLAAGWAHNGVGVLLAGDYIRTEFEARAGRVGWEGAWSRRPLARPFSMLAVISSSGLFLSVQLLTWGLGLSQFGNEPRDAALAGIGGAAIVATFLLMRYYSSLQMAMTRPKTAKSYENVAPG